MGLQVKRFSVSNIEGSSSMGDKEGVTEVLGMGEDGMVREIHLLDMQGIHKTIKG